MSVSVSDVMSCSLPEWYERFRKVTLKSVIIPLPDAVLDYLRLEGSLVLPKECHDRHGQADGDQGDEAWEDEEEQEEQPHFPDFSNQIRRALTNLGGQAFCKLNWSAPRDATWVAFGNSLRCSDLQQVYLLLKSSDFVRHDLVMPFEGCSDAEEASPVKYALVLRKWTEINPGHEFRCFVRDGRLVAVTQRDGTNFYKHIKDQKDSVVSDISSFFDEQVRDKFGPATFVFDVVRSAKDVVLLLDFNPFGATTDPVLYSWPELRDLSPNEEDPVSFRCVETDAGIQPNGMRQYSLPVDMVDLASGNDPDKLIDFLKLQRQVQGNESSTS